MAGAQAHASDTCNCRYKRGSRILTRWELLPEQRSSLQAESRLCISLSTSAVPSRVIEPRPHMHSVIEGTRSNIVVEPRCAHRPFCFRYGFARGDRCTLRSTSTSRYCSSPVKSSTPSRISMNYTRTMISSREAEHHPHCQRLQGDLPELRLERSAVIIEESRNSSHPESVAVKSSEQ